jgi:hypothetical protein
MVCVFWDNSLTSPQPSPANGKYQHTNLLSITQSNRQTYFRKGAKRHSKNLGGQETEKKNSRMAAGDNSTQIHIHFYDFYFIMILTLSILETNSRQSRPKTGKKKNLEEGGLRHVGIASKMTH